MFTPRHLNRTVSQKQRGRLHGGASLLFAGGAVNLGNVQYSLNAISSGFLHPRCLELIVTFARKSLNIPQKSTKIWVNLHACHLVTRKALNVRMGKGKGSRIGLNARVSAGNRIIAVNFCRLGLWVKLVRFVRARCSFRLCETRGSSGSFFIAQGRSGSFRFVGNGSKTRNLILLQKRYITSRVLETLSTLQRLGYLQAYIYFRDLFQFYKRTLPRLGNYLPSFNSLQVAWVLKYSQGIKSLSIGRLGTLLLQFLNRCLRSRSTQPRKKLRNKRGRIYRKQTRDNNQAVRQVRLLRFRQLSRLNLRAFRS